MWAITRSKDAWNAMPGGRKLDYNNIKDINKQIDKLYKKMREAEYQGKRDMAQEYYEDIDKLQKKKEFLIKGATS
jgi:RNase P subunit RPR2